VPRVDDAKLKLHYHPFTRAASVVGMLEAVEQNYELVFIDFRKGEQKEPLNASKNKMGKVPTLIDDTQVVTESAAIGLYLADRYALGRLAPQPNDPARGTYLRWSFFAPSVIEPAAYAQGAKWDYKPGSAGWGRYEDMLDSASEAINADPEGPWLLGERFTMADIIFGGTLRFMLQFKMVQPRDEYIAYTEALSAHPAIAKGQAINGEYIAKHDLAK